MAAPLIIEAFDEGERRIARLGLCLEPAASEKLALERGEEALAHGIVVCVADRTHRGAHAGVTAAVAELDRLKLTRFCGHRTVWVQGVHDGQDKIALRT